MRITTALLTCLGFGLAACAGPGERTGAVVIPGAVNYHIGGSQGCGSSIAAFESVIDSDMQTGNLNKSVHGRVTADLAPVKNTCTAGRDADATRQLAAVKTRYGYR